MKLSVLMIGLSQRPWQIMAGQINRQIAEFPESVEFLTYIDNGELPSGAKRQQLAKQARGDYVAWVDDDDKVSNDYVRRLVTATDSNADVLGITLRFDDQGIRSEIWKFGLWPDNRKKGQMSANHLCAWKRSLTELISWTPELSHGDDQAWYGPLLAANAAKTCHRIDPVIYHYRFNPRTTVNQATPAKEKAKEYCGAGLDCFRDAAGSIYIQHGYGANVARGPAGDLRVIAELTYFYTIRLK